MSGDARDFNNIETRAVINFVFLQGKTPKEIHAILTETLGEHAASSATVRNWVAFCQSEQFGHPSSASLCVIIVIDFTRSIRTEC
jgi:hypothetical protein